MHEGAPRDLAAIGHYAWGMSGTRSVRGRLAIVAVLGGLGVSGWAAGARADGPRFAVGFDARTRGEPATGRLVVYLIREGARIGPRENPADGPFWHDPQPMYGIDVAGLAPGAAAVVDEKATAFPEALDRLAPGTYRAQAVLDLHRDDSDWGREPGNLYSDPITFKVEPNSVGQNIVVRLSHAVEPERLREVPGVELFELRSELLSAFHGREVKLRAGVIRPVNQVAHRRYPAVYEVPGFGGNHAEAFDPYGVYRARLPAGSAWIALRERAFWIVLDPESGHGHTLLADSANNGPRARALVEELIPALEARYGLAAAPEARLLRGHSSGGWATLWLAITHPETFGACWSSAPDPVDFRRFQLPDIYGQPSLYVGPAAPGAPDAELPSLRQAGQSVLTIRQENLIEEVLGPDNTSGQQWDSWMAVWGPRNERGNPAPLYDPVTGAIDPALAERYRPYDIAERLRADSASVGLIFHQRIRLLVGGEDSFYLNEAVALLKPEVEKLSFLQYPEGRHGYIKIIPGRDHGTVLTTPEALAIPAEMLEHLVRVGLPGGA